MAAGDVNTNAGCKLFVGTTATNLLTDTYIEVSEVMNGGEFGPVFQEITYDTLGNRNTRKFKGQRNDGNMDLELGHAPKVDLGQAAMRVALEGDQDYNFKVTLNDDSDLSGATPTTFYFKAKVMSYRRVIGAPNNVVQARTTLGIKSGSTIEVDAS